MKKNYAYIEWQSKLKIGEQAPRSKKHKKAKVPPAEKESKVDTEQTAILTEEQKQFWSEFSNW